MATLTKNRLNGNGHALDILVPMEKPSTKRAGKTRTVSKQEPVEGGKFAIPELRWRWLEVELIGESPLVTNRFREDVLKGIEDKQQGEAQLKKAKRVPEKEFLGSIHWIDEKKKRYGFPAIGLKKAMATAGMRFAEKMKRTEAAGQFFIHGPHHGLIEIIAPFPTMVTDIVKLNGKVIMPVYRPYFYPWRMKVFMRFAENFLSKSDICNLFNLAGQCVSIGAWGVEHLGDKGCFRLSPRINDHGFTMPKEANA